MPDTLEAINLVDPTFARPTLKSYTSTSTYLENPNLGGWNTIGNLPSASFPVGASPSVTAVARPPRRQFTTTLELCCANSVLSPDLVFLTSQISSGPRINSKRSEGNRRAIEKTSTSFSDASFDAHQKRFRRPQKISSNPED